MDEFIEKYYNKILTSLPDGISQAELCIDLPVVMEIK